MYLCTSICLILNLFAAIKDTTQKPIIKGTNLKTLVYFASGPYKKVYESLPYDLIYLVDYCFTGKGNRSNGNSDRNIQVSESGKVVCLGMDCLDAVNYLKKHKVKIDCLVALNEGLFEGGGKFAVNGDMFLGYCMPILSDEYIHIVNKNYYGNNYHVTMNLPFEMADIKEGEPGYLNPLVFSSDEYNKEHAKVYRMTKQVTEGIIDINPNIRTSIIHDSIWNNIDELDLLAISITPQGQGDFFQKLNKVVSLRDNSIEHILDFCEQKKIERLGLTPWAKGNYSSFIDNIKNYTQEYPKVITLFHLNQKDYKSLKELS